MSTLTTFSLGIVQMRNQFPHHFYSKALRKFVDENIFPQRGKNDDAGSLTQRAFSSKPVTENVSEVSGLDHQEAIESNVGSDADDDKPSFHIPKNANAFQNPFAYPMRFHPQNYLISYP